MEVPLVLTVNGWLPTLKQRRMLTEHQDKMKPTNPLERDLAAYEKQLPTLKEKAGKFAVFFEGSLLGVFDTKEEAFAKGYEKAGSDPFLVQQISIVPIVQHFTRAIKFECLTSC